jgi:hypothetical protein
MTMRLADPGIILVGFLLLSAMANVTSAQSPPANDATNRPEQAEYDWPVSIRSAAVHTFK